MVREVQRFDIKDFSGTRMLETGRNAVSALKRDRFFYVKCLPPDLIDNIYLYMDKFLDYSSSNSKNYTHEKAEINHLTVTRDVFSCSFGDFREISEEFLELTKNLENLYSTLYVSTNSVCQAVLLAENLPRKTIELPERIIYLFRYNNDSCKDELLLDPHFDTSISISTYSSPGLEARTNDDLWLDVFPKRDEIAFLPGTYLQNISSHNIQPCTHRVRNHNTSRKSIVFGF